MNPSIVVIRLQYQRRPEGEAGFTEDTTSFPMRAAVRIREAFKPKFSEPFRLLRSLIPMALALFKPRKQPSCISAKVHNLSAPFFAPELQKQQTTGAFRDVRKPFRGLRNA